MRKNLARQRLVACTLLAALMFNAPFLWLFDSPNMVFGIPHAFVYIFGVWAILIAALAWIVERD